MGRPPDSTKLPPLEAQRLRDLVRRGKEQYGLTWEAVAEQMDREEKTIRNYMDASHPLPARIARELLGGVLNANGARAWRKEHGCCPEHRTGDGISCIRRDHDGKYAPCDLWYMQASSWWLSRPWVLAPRAFVPALIAPAAFDALAEELARQICSQSGLGVSKRDSVARAIFSYLNRNAADLASDAVFLFGSRIEEIVKNAEVDKQGGSRDQLLDHIPLDHVDLGRFARSALMFVARLYWPDLKDRTTTVPLPVGLDDVLSHKDAAFRKRLETSSEDDV